MLSADPAYVVVADPTSLRWELYEAALRRFWATHHREVRIHLLDWRELAAADGDVRTSLPEGPAIVRVESPGRDPEVFDALLRAGQRQQGVSGPSPGNLWSPGWIGRPRLIYQGLSHLLAGLQRSLQTHPDLRLSANLDDVVELFDKNRTTQRLLEAGLTCPETFAADGTPEALIYEMRCRDWNHGWVKLAHGSCASGIAYVETRVPSAVTTVVQLGGRLHNTRRVRSISGDELDVILEFILGETATVQQNIRKVRVGGRNFDVRVVVIGGRVAATIFRVSAHPMTNLHLGGQRGDPDECLRTIPRRHWLDALDQCCAAADLYDLPAVGIDVAFDRVSRRPFLLELNAFGDFFPNWHNERQQSVHAMEIEYTARRFGLIGGDA